MGRPKLPAGEARTVHPLRISPNEKAMYIEAAKADGKDLADWIRSVLTKAAESTKRNTESSLSASGGT
jgi:hypothetical protein